MIVLPGVEPDADYVLNSRLFKQALCLTKNARFSLAPFGVNANRKWAPCTEHGSGDDLCVGTHLKPIGVVIGRRLVR